MERKNKQAFWARHVRAYEASGETRPAYCARHRLKVRSLDYWRRRMPILEKAPAFVPVRVVPGAAVDAPLLECPGGARLRLPRDCDPTWLLQILSGLR
ncbi:MAG: IS66 family insertion sequence element accessory protein TnpA [Terriglobales bacterium]